LAYAFPNTGEEAAMSDTLLTTKLFVPQTPPELVPRPHLAERLSEGLARQLTLVSAPAGFGKSTLVTGWLAEIGHTPFLQLHLMSKVPIYPCAASSPTMVPQTCWLHVNVDRFLALLANKD